jgi:hypothetical protein
MRQILIAIAIAATLGGPAPSMAQTRKPAATAPAPATAAASWRGPTAEQQAEIAALRKEVERTTQSLREAKQEDDKYSGGLIKSQIQLRMEIMRNTIALLEHRIRALETGARFVQMEVATINTDATVLQAMEKDIASSKDKIAETASQSARYSGGLIKAQLDSTRATQEQTLAMLEQRYVMAKYGITYVAAPAGQDARRAAAAAPVSTAEEKPAASEPAVADTIMTVNLLAKRQVKQKYDEMIVLDMDVSASGLDRPARAIKGVLKVTDLFGDVKVRINWDFDNPVAPGGVVRERGNGLNYNQFRDQDRWLAATEQQNMKVVFTVKSILYEDGTRRDF